MSVFAGSNPHIISARGSIRGEGENPLQSLTGRRRRRLPSQSITFDSSNLSRLFDTGYIALVKNQPPTEISLEPNIFRFGTILLESDIDLSPSDAYKIYKSRWEIELVMRYYKQTCEFDETRVHDDYSVIGSEFCCFIATVMTYRLLNAFDKADLFKSLTYKKIMKILVRAKKIRLHSGGEWNLVGMTPSQLEVIAKLGLIPMPEPKKKRGRKPKQEV